jgi:ABC-type sugar transport system substrate-binding protein
MLAALVSSVVWCGLNVARADDSWPGPTVPAKAPKDIKVGVVACGAKFRGCYAPALAAAEAATALGWTVTVYDGAGTQEKQNGGMLDALSSGANLLLTAALDPDLIQLGLSKAKEAGVPVVSSSAGTDTPNPVITPPKQICNRRRDRLPGGWTRPRRLRCQGIRWQGRCCRIRRR